ncbi:MAG TPA: GDSL-type esterase/lipase family protein [Oculatellaceae cyanobacterium]
MRLSEPRTKILIMGLLPCAPDDPAKIADMAKIKQVNSEISRLANGNTIRFLDIGDKFKDAKGNARQDLLPDYLHPNYAGYEVWSDEIKPVVESMTRWLAHIVATASHIFLIGLPVFYQVAREFIHDGIGP